MPKNLHGWLNIDKPYGITSMEVIRKIKKITHVKKIGHAGTLDPLATGILPIAFGEATKTIPYLLNAEKTYLFTVKWGEMTDTLDSEGKIICQSEHIPSKLAIEQALKSFIGTSLQTPPEFSAVKINGKRAYALARAGKKIDLAPKLVRLYEANLKQSDYENKTAQILIKTGKGFYVRAFARDLAKKLGSYGYVEQLRRIKLGVFTEKESILLEKFKNIVHNASLENNDILLDVKTALVDIPALPIQKQDIYHLKQGRSLNLLPDKKAELLEYYTKRPVSVIHSDQQKKVVFLYKKQLIAIGEIKEDKAFPKRVFNLN